MRIIFAVLILFGFFESSTGQNSFKRIQDQPYVAPMPLQTAHRPGENSDSKRLINQWVQKPISFSNNNSDLIESYSIETSGSFWIDLKENDLLISRSAIKEAINTTLSIRNENDKLKTYWITETENMDKMGVEHIRVQQYIEQIPIKGQNLILHRKEESLIGLNGFAWTGQMPEVQPEGKPAEEVIQAVKNYLLDQQVSFQETKSLFPGYPNVEHEAELIWYPVNGKHSLITLRCIQI